MNQKNLQDTDFLKINNLGFLISDWELYDSNRPNRTRLLIEGYMKTELLFGVIEFLKHQKECYFITPFLDNIPWEYSMFNISKGKNIYKGFQQYKYRNYIFSDIDTENLKRNPEFCCLIVISRDYTEQINGMTTGLNQNILKNVLFKIFRNPEQFKTSTQLNCN